MIVCWGRAELRGYGLSMDWLMRGGVPSTRAPPSGGVDEGVGAIMHHMYEGHWIRSGCQ